MDRSSAGEIATAWLKEWSALQEIVDREEARVAIEQGVDEDQLSDNFADAAMNLVSELIRSDPESAWLIILELVDRAPTERSVGAIGAGPLEEFLRGHVIEYIRRVEREANGSARFRQALSRVWGWADIPTTMSERLRAAARMDD
jgi:hypothetical protein